MDVPIYWPGMQAVEFWLDLSDLLDATGGWITSEIPGGDVSIGDLSSTGVQIGFAYCQVSPQLLYTVEVFLPNPVVGTVYVAVTESTLDSHLLAMALCTRLASPPTSASLIETPQPAIGGQGIASSAGVTCTVSAKRSSWGRIKSLYGEP